MVSEFARPHPVRRVLRLGLLSLSLGIVTTWLVAWACGVWAPMRSESYQSQDFQDNSTLVHLFRERGYGVDSIVVLFHTTATASHRDGSAFEKLARLDILPRWTRAHRCWSSAQAFPAGALAGPIDVGVGAMWSEAAFGWPLPALRCMVTATAVLDGLTPPAWLPAMRTSDRPLPAIPYRPVWSGLLLNTLFFAALWSAAALFSGVARQRLRISQGHCPWCNYDLRSCPENGCPECGSPDSLRMLWAVRKGSRPLPQPAPPAARNHVRRVKLVSAAALAIVVVSLGVVWALWPSSRPPPEWAVLRQRAYAFLSQAEGYSTVASYIDEHFQTVADITDRKLAEKAAREKVDVDLCDYVVSVRVEFLLLAKKDNRADVFEFIRYVRQPRPD
jgi:hypothetical protein